MPNRDIFDLQAAFLDKYGEILEGLTASLDEYVLNDLRELMEELNPPRDKKEETLTYILQKEIGDIKNKIGRAVVLLSDKHMGLSITYSPNISEDEANVLSSILEGKEKGIIEYKIEDGDKIEILKKYRMDRFKNCKFLTGHITSNIYLTVAVHPERKDVDLNEGIANLSRYF